MSPERPPWDQPLWDEHVDIWDSISDSDDDRKLRVPLQMIHQANDGSLDQQLPYPERRLGLEVHELDVGGPYRKLEAYAYDQVLSPIDMHVIESNQIGYCIGQIFDREYALDNCFSISSQNADCQTRVFLDVVYDNAGNLLPKPVDPAYNLFTDDGDDDDDDYDDDGDDDEDDEDDDPLANHDLIGEHSFVLVERVRVDASYRRMGIGSSLLEALVTEALLMLPSIRFVVSWPSASDSADLEAPGPSHSPTPAGTTGGGTTTTTTTTTAAGGGGSEGSDGGDSSGSPRAGRGQKRAEAFHRAAGFRRLGVTRFWAKRIEPSA